LSNNYDFTTLLFFLFVSVWTNVVNFFVAALFNSVNTILTGYMMTNRGHTKDII